MTRSFSAITVFYFLFSFISGHAQDTSTSRLILPEKAFTVPFTWKGDSVHAQWEPNAAMLIPVKLPGCPKQFYMQFDLGAPHSIFYKRRLIEIGRKYPSSIQIADTSTIIKHISFTTGKSIIQARDINLFQVDNDHNIDIIGTLGMDFLGSQTVMINYPNKTISINQSVPEKWKTKLSDFIYTSRGVLLPAFIKGKKTLLFFDSGSSAFPLLTNKATALQLAQSGTTLVSYPVSSWGIS